MVHLFVAAWPTDEVIQELAAIPQPIEPGVRWIPRQNWHITLRYIGDADPDARATPAEALVTLGRAPTAHLPPAPVSPASPASPAPPLQLALEPHAESTSWMVPLVMLVAAVVILFGVTWLVRP